MDKKMSAKLWLCSFFFCCAIGLFLIVLVNYFVDPLWLFDHQHFSEYPQQRWDERKQKSNYLAFRDQKFDGLLLGSSRADFLDVSFLENGNIFNYACSRMKPIEFSSYIHHFKKTATHQRPIKIYLAFDFFGVNKHAPFGSEMPEFYFSQINGGFYRLKHLISIDCLKFSFFNLSERFSPRKAFYNRKHPTHRIYHREEISEEALNKLLKFDQKRFYENFQYEDSFKNILSEIRSQNSHDEIIPFTTPISVPLFLLLLEAKRWDDYSRWLHELVEVFGCVYHFMDVNEFTENYQSRFLDYHHLKSEMSEEFFNRLVSLKETSSSPDQETFGICLTASNIEEYLENLLDTVKSRY